ncbi:MAG: ribonuclease Z [Elusimicrobiota bacterium]|jgi:ribonuclease BN (tRNA processing enzyme)
MSLKTKGRSEVVILGSGALDFRLGEQARSAPGLALRLGRKTLLFDLGFGAMGRLLHAGIDPSSVCAAFFTHRHPDHVGDIPALLFHLNSLQPPASGILKIFGPRGFSSFMARLTRAHHPWLRPRGWRLEIRELEERDHAQGSGWKVRCREVPHSTEALAFRLESSAGSLGYTGDTDLDEGLPGFFAGLDLLVAECTYPSAEPRRRGHMTVNESVALSRACAAKKTIFTHLTAGSEKELSRTPLCKGREFIAYDLMRIPLR